MEDSKIKKYIYIVGFLILFLVGYGIIKLTDGLEILSKLNENDISYGLIFLIGLLASFHCIGMCGGLVVTYTTASKEEQDANTKKTKLKPHFYYNLGRFISYTIIGAILGGVGSFFAINPSFTGTITLIAGLFMILMGASLVTKNKYLEKIKLKTPKFIGRYIFSNQGNKKPKGPFIIGLLTGFMPCGPLQAMQLYALTSGSFVKGGLSMAIYALGTIPLMFGFGSFISLIKHDKIKKIMQISGIVVIVLGLFMINRGLTNFGYGFKGLLASDQTSQTEYLIDGDVTEYQTVEMKLTAKGYEPNVLYVKKDIPVKWVINVEQMSGCTDAIILPDYDIEKDLVKGENIIEFTPDRLGEIKFSCWMQMVWGKFIVTNN
ncbi:MAG: sulfite exporter TauE/SafE family protein [Patescibacteria group bacterium]